MIDDHAHPFPLEFAPFQPAEISLDVGGPEAVDRRAGAGPGRLFQELLHVSLARLIGLDADASDADVAAARDHAASADWGRWVRRLFEDARIDGMLLDFGVGTAHGGPVDAYRALTGRPVWWLARIDPLVDELIGAGAAAGEIVAAVEKMMDDAVAQGAVGFKTIAAYRTGLAIDPYVGLAAAGASLGEGTELPVRRRGKALRDLVTTTVVQRAADLQKPVQIHTGFGDSEIRLAESNPLLLEELLRSPAGSAATIVLIHGSYPWQEELAYLATVKPNVYAEVSLSNLFAPLLVADRLARLVELAPRHKLLAGSDGHHLPETHWFGCRVLQDGFAEVAARLRGAGAREGFVEAARRALFEENAREVYGLSSAG